MRDVETNANMGVVAKAKSLKSIILQVQEFIITDEVEFNYWCKFSKKASHNEQGAKGD